MVLSSIRRLVGAAAVLAVVLSVSTRAAAACAGPELIPIAIGVALLPSEAGAAIATDGVSPSRALLGWSYQVPFAPFDDVSRHRIVGGVDLLLGSDGASWRGRLGYRFNVGHFLAGLGPELDSRGVSLSPELGLRFRHDSEEGPGIHVITRAQLTPEGVRGATLMLGWSFL